ncbi:MAG: helix-turn-helix domain-containing protein [Flavobacteriales bacterium]
MEFLKKHTSFGEQLRQLRERTGMSLREVSQNLDIDPSLLAKIERNQRPPTKLLIKRVANFFEVSEKELREEFLSDQIAYKIIDEEADLNILKVAEKKIAYIKATRND